MPIQDLIAIFPEVVLTLTAVTVMLLGAFLKGRGAHLLNTITLLGLCASTAAVVYQLRFFGPAFQDMLAIDPFSLFFHFLFLLIAALVVLFSSDYLRQERLPASEYYALVLFATIGMGLMAAANELMMVFIGLEISSLASYVLVGFRRTVAASTEGALKYFLLGSFATAFLLYGIALLYGVTGSTRLTQIRDVLYGGETPVTASIPGAGWQPAAIGAAQFPWTETEFPAALLGLAIALVFVGLAFKVSAAPFQVWTPDVYQGAPAPVAAFLSTGPKAAAFAAFLRIFFYGFESSAGKWSALVWVSAVFSMTIGNLAAIWQTNVKRMLAYSSIAHAGYILVAFTAHSTDSISAILFYLAAYAFMNMGAFFVVSHLSSYGERYVEIDDYTGLGFRAPWTAACLSIFLLSLIGIPLTAGFLGKFYVFRASLGAHLIWLTVLGVLNSGIAAYYYLRVIVVMYMQPASAEGRDLQVPPAPGLSITSGSVLALCAVATLYLGIFPQVVLRLAIRAAQWFPDF